MPSKKKREGLRELIEGLLSRSNREPAAIREGKRKKLSHAKREKRRHADSKSAKPRAKKAWKARNARPAARKPRIGHKAAGNATQGLHKIPAHKAEAVKDTIAEGYQGNQQLLRTQIDRLLDTLSKEKEMRLEDAASMFNVSTEIIERWGKVLEEHRLAELHYPAFGKPAIRVPGFRKPRSRKGK